MQAYVSRPHRSPLVLTSAFLSTRCRVRPAISPTSAYLSSLACALPMWGLVNLKGDREVRGFRWGKVQRENLPRAEKRRKMEKEVGVKRR